MGRVFKLLLSLVVGLCAVSLTMGGDDFKNNPKPKDFLGKWVGKWDDKWKVQFTVTREEKGGPLSIVYEVEESLGKPFIKSKSTAKIEDNRLVMPATGPAFIEISVFANEKDKGKAKGNFKQPRTAVLTREKE